jgi:hypothetical protein
MLGVPTDWLPQPLSALVRLSTRPRPAARHGNLVADGFNPRRRYTLQIRRGGGRRQILRVDPGFNPCLSRPVAGTLPGHQFDVVIAKLLKSLALPTGLEPVFPPSEGVNAHIGGQPRIFENPLK